MIDSQTKRMAKLERPLRSPAAPEPKDGEYEHLPHLILNNLQSFYGFLQLLEDH